MWSGSASRGLRRLTTIFHVVLVLHFPMLRELSRGPSLCVLASDNRDHGDRSNPTGPPQNTRRTHRRTGSLIGQQQEKQQEQQNAHSRGSSPASVSNPFLSGATGTSRGGSASGSRPSSRTPRRSRANAVDNLQAPPLDNYPVLNAPLGYDDRGSPIPVPIDARHQPIIAADMQGVARLPMSLVLGDKLLKKTNQDHFPERTTEVSTEQELADAELVVVYFSAHWCPPCRQYFVYEDF